MIPLSHFQEKGLLFEENRFDETVGKLEEIIFGAVQLYSSLSYTKTEAGFQSMIRNFFERNQAAFDFGTDENKLVYTSIFDEYVSSTWKMLC